MSQLSLTDFPALTSARKDNSPTEVFPGVSSRSFSHLSPCHSLEEGHEAEGRILSEFLVCLGIGELRATLERSHSHRRVQMAGWGAKVEEVTEQWLGDTRP